VVIDLEQLRRNLGPNANRAEEFTGRLIRTMATVGPTAKRGSTAPFAHAELVLMERGDHQPRSLANAFRQAVPLSRDGAGDVMQDSVRALIRHREELAGMYGEAPMAIAATIHRGTIGEVPAMSLDAGIQHMLGLAGSARDTGEAV
jgi:CRISPR system Cascade subunit CasC